MNDTLPKALIFDLGGVVIDINLDLAFSYWSKNSNQSFEDIKARFSFDHYYRCHERGEINASDYFKSLRQSLRVDISEHQFLTGWNSIYIGEVPGVFNLLKKAAEKLPIYAFTNSNSAHQKVWSKRFSNILSLFNSVFISSEIGKRKPEPEAFQAVANSVGLELNQMIFYDDAIENIEGAQKVGLNTVHVKSTSDIEISFNEIFKSIQ